MPGAVPLPHEKVQGVLREMPGLQIWVDPPPEHVAPLLMRHVYPVPCSLHHSVPAAEPLAHGLQAYRTVPGEQIRVEPFDTHSQAA